MTTPATDTMLNHPHLRMIRIEGGSFLMGSDAENADTDEKPVHTVTVSDFELAAYPVTQALWEAVMGAGSNPSRFKGPRRPVERVSWYDAAAFCNRLNARAGLPCCYFSDEQHTQAYALEGELPNEGPKYYRPTPGAFRLPTEAEWEYAARGGRYGADTEYAGADRLKDVGWYGANSGSETQPVGLLLPNALGLYDLNGNVWEWCWDWYGEYEPAPQIDPTGPVEGERRVLRGGSWDYIYINCRSANRNWFDPDYWFSNYFGFRVSRHL